MLPPAKMKLKQAVIMLLGALSGIILAENISVLKRILLESIYLAVGAVLGAGLSCFLSFLLLLRILPELILQPLVPPPPETKPKQR